MREKRQTRPEGSRHASPLHAMQPAPSERTGDRSVPVRSEDPVQKSCTADECCAARFCAGLLAGRLACGTHGHFARRRALWSRCTPLVSQPRLPASTHACEHAVLMLTCARAYVLARVCEADRCRRVQRRFGGRSTPHGRPETGTGRGARGERVRRPCVARERLKSSPLLAVRSAVC